MDDFDRRLLDLVQERFPIHERPYLQLAEQLGTSEVEVIRRMRLLVERGVVRDLSPVFDLAKLGYQSTLAAIDVPEERIEAVAETINAHEEVTHNYLRQGHPNVWFTVIAESEEAVQRILSDIERKADCGPVLALPAERKFRARVVFEFTEADDA